MAPSPILGQIAIEKKAFGSPSTAIAKLTQRENTNQLLYDCPMNFMKYQLKFLKADYFTCAYNFQEGDGPITKGTCLVPGNKFVASGYAMFGSATMVVLTTGNGVNGFTLDPVIFYLFL